MTILDALNQVLSAAGVEFLDQGPLGKLGSIALLVGIVGGLFSWLGGRSPRQRARDWRLKYEAEERLRRDAETERDATNLTATALVRCDPHSALRTWESEHKDGNEEKAYRGVRMTFEEARMAWADVCTRIAEFEVGRLDDPERLAVGLRFSRLAALMRPEDETTTSFAVGIGDLLAVRGEPGRSGDASDLNWEASLDAALPYGVDGINLGNNLLTEARSLYSSTKLRPALIAARRAVALLRRNLGTGDRATLQAARLEAEILWGWGRIPEALKCVSELVGKQALLFGNSDPDTLSSMELQAQCLARTDRAGEALAIVDRVIHGFESLKETDHVTSLPVTRAQYLRALDRPNEAIEDLEKLRPWALQSQGDERLRRFVLNELADSLNQVGRPNEAIPLLKRVLELLPQAPAGTRAWQNMILTEIQLAQALEKTDRAEEALGRLKAHAADVESNFEEPSLFRYMFDAVMMSLLSTLGRSDEADALKSKMKMQEAAQADAAAKLGRPASDYDLKNL